MFSGIVETTAKILRFEPRSSDVWDLVLERPPEFSDLKAGDSVAVNGVCLTVEADRAAEIPFAVARETLDITSWDRHLGRLGLVNLERSLRLGDRIHGHLVQGHVDGMARVVSAQGKGGALLVTIEIPAALQRFVWKKGSIAINGVSLTINEVASGNLEFCLIPETLKRSNLSALKIGDFVTVEVDTLARYFERSREFSK